MVVRWTVIVAVLALGACAPDGPESPLLLVRGPAEIAGVSPAWCYRTLAQPDCYIERVPGATHRLIGAYVPLPSDAAGY